MVAVDGEWRKRVAPLGKVKVKVKSRRIAWNIVFRIAILIASLTAFAVSSVLAFTTIRAMQTQTRGVVYGVLPQTAFGINVALEHYSDTELAYALQMIRAAGFRYVRQHFYWNAIEPRKNEFTWSTWDRIVHQSERHGLAIVAVIDTTPVWARHPGEADLLYAPPADVNDYARLIATLVSRYGDRVRYLQIWDNPNVHPFWGRRNADPLDYAALLRAAATAARAANPNVQIISAGLAPSQELIRGHPDYSDILFLRGLYNAGLRDSFDIVGVKAYGMWTGPEDRRVDKDVFNFSRAILLREEMLAYGDADKPVWAVEFGWNALPADWRGAPSPWGSDTETVQSQRLAEAVQRARREWAWMPVMIVQTFQPNAPADDPQWGFALVDRNFQRRSLYHALTNAIATPVAPASFDFARFYATLAALTTLALAALAMGARAMWELAWEKIWLAIEARLAALPEWALFVWLTLAVLALYYSPNTILNFVLLALIVLLFALRLDLGLAITVFTIPFYLFPKKLFGDAQFSLIEILTLASVAAWLIRQSLKIKMEGLSLKCRVKLSTTDWAMIVLVVLGIISVKNASNFGVAMREWRVIIIEPALLYALIRASHLPHRAVYRLITAFLASAFAVSVIGIYQYLFTDWVIVGGGVRRVLAVYGSPNNLALYLDRALPLALALFIGRNELRPSQRVFYLLVAIVSAVALYLTFSRGAWLGIVAGLACLGCFGNRNIRFAVLAGLVSGAILVIPFLQTERAQSLFQIGTGTGFFRVSVWQSAIAMIRDHPLWGVGLDNFLYEYPKYIHPAAWREPNLSHPHNIVLDFWVRLGIGGVGVLVGMLSAFYRCGWNKLATHRALVIGLMAAMTATLAHGCLDAAYFYVDLAFVWMLLVGVMATLDDEAICHFAGVHL